MVGSRLLGLVLSAAAIALLAWAVPVVAGARWTEVAAALRHVGTARVLLLCTLWGLGLWTYTFVLSAALPGLTRRRALLVNCVGSAVSNLFPLGGTAGVAVTYSMARHWGHPPRAIGVFTVLTGVCNVLARLVVSVAGALALARSAVPGMGRAAVAGVSVLLLLPPALLAVARRRAPGRHDGPGLLPRARRWTARFREDCRDLVRTAWPALAAGMTATLAAQALLFWACLHAAGVRTSAADVLAVFAASRLLTQIGLTPGGIGVTESAATYALVTLGGAPAAVAAGVLLYAAFTHLMEIPAGALAGALWLWRRGRGPVPVPGRAQV
ncbi:YbhN family protein [Streptomyces gamaensis]|uniref:YbhN family protein n=1 Tax=Streptomyces gamaensis TaxID=1763542 RepID=A0ABW0YWN6_9ACTN